MGLIAIRCDKFKSYKRRGWSNGRRRSKRKRTAYPTRKKEPSRTPHSDCTEYNRIQPVQNLKNCQEYARPWLQSNAPSAQGPATRSLLCRNASVILQGTSVLYLYWMSFDWDQVQQVCLLPICKLQVTSFIC